MIRNPTKAPTGRAASHAPDSAAVDTPGESEVRAQLDKIVASAAFTAATQIAGLLRFTVEETLAGRHDGAVAEVVGIRGWRNLRLVQPARAGVVAPAEITP